MKHDLHINNRASLDVLPQPLPLPLPQPLPQRQVSSVVGLEKLNEFQMFGTHLVSVGDSAQAFSAPAQAVPPKLPQAGFYQTERQSGGARLKDQPQGTTRKEGGELRERVGGERVGGEKERVGGKGE